MTIVSIYPSEVQAKETKENKSSPIEQCLDKSGNELNQCLDKNKEEKSDEGIISWIVLLAVAIIAPIAALTCFNCPDVWVFSAAAAVWLFAEFSTMAQYRKRSEHIKKILDDKDANKQIATLRAAQLHSENGVQAAEEKKTWAMIAAFGFTAAAGVATLLALNPFNLFGAGATFDCNGGLLGGLIDGMIGSHDGINQDIKKLTPKDIAREINVQSQIHPKNPHTPVDVEQRKYDSYKLKIIAKIQELITPAANAEDQAKKDEGAPKNEEEQRNQKKQDEHFMNTLLSLGIGGGVGAVLGIILIIKKPAVKFLQKPLTRIILFSATAAVAWLARGEIEEARKKLDTDAKVYKKLADELEKRINPKSNIGDEEDGKAPSTKMAEQWPEGSAYDRQNPTDSTRLCGNANKNNKITPSANCNCRPNCRGTRTPRFSNKSLTKNPFLAEYANTADAVNQASKQIANGNIAGGKATISGSGGGKLAGKLKKMNDKLKQKINDKRKNPIPFNALTKKTVANILQAARKKKGSYPKNWGSPLSLNSKGSLSLAAFGNKNRGSLKKELAKAKKVHQASGGNPKKDDFNYKVDFSNDENKAQRSSSSLPETSEVENIDEKMDDITKQTKVPIWNILSLRYQKTIYPMFIEK